MKAAGLFLGVISLFVIGMLFFYWMIPTEEVVYGVEKSDNFSLNGNKVVMQFYNNMRFPESRISFSISDDCTIKKKSDMRWAFDIMENETILEFYEMNEGGEIVVYCENKNRVEDGLFIAGEGGPTNITKGENFNVILGGQILLIRDIDCEKPIVGIHELIHVLGFNHSENPNNIMYPIARCEQTIGNEIVDEINRLYEIPSEADLMIRDVSAQVNGLYLNLNVSIFNDGFKSVEESDLVLYANEDEIKRVGLQKLKIGSGLNIQLSNVLIKKIKIEELKVAIESDMTELSLENNEVLLTKT